MALSHELYLSALALALTLPDTCGKAEYPNEKYSGARYKKWCSQYVISDRHDSPYGYDMPYLSEEIIYNLRNSLLHQSTPNIEKSTIHESRCRVDKFELVITGEDGTNGDLSEVAYDKEMFLYSVSDSKITIDVKCAFLVELAEPIVEVVKERTYYFASLEPGSRGTTLKNCLDALIIKYGKEIFNKELSSSQYNQFLNVLVNSRVNIMHVKRNQRKPALNGKQSCLYAQKLSLLYRKILFELLQINDSLYLEKLKHCVLNLDNWNSISDDFLSWLSK